MYMLLHCTGSRLKGSLDGMLIISFYPGPIDHCWMSVVKMLKMSKILKWPGIECREVYGCAELLLARQTLQSRSSSRVVRGLSLLWQ
ncbi:hypothetical protein D3C78_1576260 [compost metagenome]